MGPFLPRPKTNCNLWELFSWAFQESLIDIIYGHIIHAHSSQYQHVSVRDTMCQNVCRDAKRC